MDQITFQIKRVQAFVASATTTKTVLAQKAGLPLSTLIGMERLDWNPRSETLRRLVRAVDAFEGRVVRPKKRQAFQPAA